MLGDALELESFALMAEENLVRLPFFGLAGAFGVRRGERRDGAAAIAHAVGLLDRPRRVVWIFPQGETRPASDPLRFEPGAAAIAARAPHAAVIPVGLRYRFGERPRPDLCIALGAPVRGVAAGVDGTAMLERAVDACLLRIDDAREMPTLLHDGSSAPLDLPTRMLAALSGVVSRWFARRLEASVAANDQRAIGPANAATRARADERDEQHRVGEPGIER
jgi:1-acyl-sn-glycerol-3-phosphate acyltransferase